MIMHIIQSIRHSKCQKKDMIVEFDMARPIDDAPATLRPSRETINKV
jgi:hypothetical protein